MADRTPDYELTPGGLLRRSRQRYGWSVEDVADELKLLPYVVEAIEQDNYAQMAGWTYAVGYLRSYAKLVGVNIESSISEHASLLPQKEDGPGTMTYRTGSKVPIPISLSWVMTAVIMIVVVGGISATYWKRANDVDRVVLESTVPEEREAVGAVSEVILGVPAAEESAELPAVSIGVESGSVEQGSTGSQSPAVTLEPEQLRVDGDAAKRALSDSDPGSSLTAELVVRPLTLTDIDTRIIGSLPQRGVDDAENSIIPPEEIEALPQSQIEVEDTEYSRTAGPRDLVLFFDQDSWADIRDAGSQQLLRESVRAGSTVRLEGEPPFTVFVGNARGVRYFYLGVEKTATAFGEGLFGRFEIGTLE